ncbi:MAG: adenosylhomocysteinase [Halobacteriales archaeon]|nr:adenosylhomocysteinase [Halobacteriales archaeon]
MDAIPSAGEQALGWVRDFSPVLTAIAEEYEDEAPFDGYTFAVSAPLTPHTGVFIETIWRAGGEVAFVGEPGTNHAGVIEELDAREGLTAYVEPDMPREGYKEAHRKLLTEARPDFIFDDGCALTATAHAELPEIAADVLGGAEQTTSGITRLEAMERAGALEFPVYGVNDTPMKHYFDNVHGTSESTLASIFRTTNTMLSGKTVVVAGYGFCGRGLARKAKGIGANTIVTEVDPRKALEALTDGHRVMPMAEAVAEADYVLPVTGSVHAVRGEHFERMADGVIVASAGTGHEIDVGELAELAADTTEPREGVTRYHLTDGRRINLLADGLVVNLAAPGAEGNPSEVMDTTFAMMVVAAYDVIAGEGGRPPGLYSIPDRLDRDVAETKLETMGVSIDEMTDCQVDFVDDWAHEGDYGWS